MAGSVRSCLDIETDPEGYVSRISGVIEKRRPGMFSGWKTRFCELKGKNFTWSEEKDANEILGSLDIRGTTIDGPSLRTGCSEVNAPKDLMLVNIVPGTGKNIELRAQTLGDARMLIKILQATSKGQRYKLADDASGRASMYSSSGVDESPIEISSTSVDDSTQGQYDESLPVVQGKWESALDDQGVIYFYNEATGESQVLSPHNLFDTELLFSDLKLSAGGT